MSDLYQRSFAGGEISPDLYARSDQTKYQTGLRLCRNFIVRKGGGVSNRPGTRFVGEGNLVAGFQYFKLIPFVFNDDQSYVLEFSPGFVRFIKRGAVITVTPPLYSASSWYNAGQTSYFGGTSYVALIDTNNQQPNVSPAAWAPMGGLGTVPYVLPTPYLTYDQLKRLNYQQIGDIVYLACPDAQVMVLRRYADDQWTFSSWGITPWTDAPDGLFVSAWTPGTSTYEYVVTAVNTLTGEESLPSTPAKIVNATPPNPTTYIEIQWNGPFEDRIEFNIYRAVNGKFRYIATVGNLDAPRRFRDVYAEPDSSSPGPPSMLIGGGAWPANDAPKVVSIIQQRLTFASTRLQPETIWMSRTGVYNDFSSSMPVQADDAMSFAIVGRRFGEVRAIFELGIPVVFTDTGEWFLKGDQDGAVLPTAINAVQQAYNGSDVIVDPAIVDDSVIYVQARGSIVRDFKYQMEGEGYSGKDLTVYATHLFSKKQIISMAYQQNPHSVVWILRSDGVLLGLSYLREHQIWGWHQHETDGKVIDVCVIPEGRVDVLYLVIERKVQGFPKYYIERMVEREDQDPLGMFFIDSGLSYDGMANQFNYPGMLMSSQALITPNDRVVLSATNNYFTSSSVGNAVVFYRYDENRIQIDSIRLNIVEYTDSSHVYVTPNRDVPVWAVNLLTWDWSYATDEFTNLGHLEGKSVAIVADGNVVANGYDEPQYIVTGGTVVIPYPASRVHIGLPYTADLETLDVDLPQQAVSVRTRPKLMSHISTVVKDTPVLWAGTSFDRLTEYKIREFEKMGDPTNPKTGFIDVTVDAAWDEESRVCIRQRDPLPATVLAVIPRTLMGKE